MFSTTKILSLVFIMAVGLVYTIFRGVYPGVVTKPFEVYEGYEATPSAIALALYGVLWSYDGW